MDSERVPVIIGDIGGTNSRLSVININIKNEEEKIEYMHIQTYKTFQYKNGLEDILKEYITYLKSHNCISKMAVLGIPGAIINNRVIISNAIPTLNGTSGLEMAKKLGIDHVIYLNDFNINGYSLQSKNMTEGVDYIHLNPNIHPEPNQTKAMIGAGTGLGTGYLTKTPYSKYYSVYSGEGGQQDFAPCNKLQDNYKHFLIEKCNIIKPSCENACSGNALTRIYKFFSEILKDENINENDINKDLMNEVINCDTEEKIRLCNDKIMNYGINNKCPLCRRTIDFFIEIYGSIAGNLALINLPFGGIYLFGGISAALGHYMKTNDIFIKNLTNKAGLQKFLERIPIYVIINEQFGVAGAAEFTKQALEEGKLDLLCL